MTDLRKAAEMALEALQRIYIAPEHEEYIRVWWPKCEEAIQALRTALAEPVKSYCGGKPNYCTEPEDWVKQQEQEPVAWMNPRNNAVIDARKKKQIGEGDGYPRFSVPLYTQPVDEIAKRGHEPVAWITRRTGDGGAYVDGYECCEPTDYGAFPVYHAPPKREWVGLTDGDLRQIILAAVGVAEAKLKEKNT